MLLGVFVAAAAPLPSVVPKYARPSDFPARLPDIVARHVRLHIGLAPVVSANAGEDAGVPCAHPLPLADSVPAPLAPRRARPVGRPDHQSLSRSRCSTFWRELRSHAKHSCIAVSRR